MTAELEAMGTALFNNEVPDMWASVAYPSQKPLGTWVPDLQSRLAFIQSWVDTGKVRTISLYVLKKKTLKTVCGS